MAYAFPPDYIFPFIYDNGHPYAWKQIDTDTCINGHLYFYDESANTITHVGTDATSTYAPTQDYLLYVTNSNILNIASYKETNPSIIYRSSRGEITCPVAFGNYVSFIEGGRFLVILNISTLQAQTVYECDNLTWAYMFDYDKLIYGDNKDHQFCLNTTTKVTSTALSNSQVGTITNSFSFPKSTIETSNTRSSTIAQTPYNDVTIPFPDYYAPLGDDFDETPSTHHFTYRYRQSMQCDGFAKYAHDRFWHLDHTLYPDNNDYRNPTWFITDSTVTADYHGATPAQMNNPSYDPLTDNNLVLFPGDKEDASVLAQNAAVAKAFFTSLNRGAFIRYTKPSATYPRLGNHSIFFDGIASDTGIYVYEANQDGANGIDYAIYPYISIGRVYGAILYYIDHSLSESCVIENTSYHLQHCENCDAFLRQPHVYDTYYPQSATHHSSACSACGKTGGSLSTHIFAGSICRICQYDKNHPAI